MSKTVCVQTFRKNYNIEKIAKRNNLPQSGTTKSDILSLFIASIPDSEATANHYIKYLVNALFRPGRTVIDNNDPHPELSLEQRGYINYLIANENTSYFARRDVTRGQVKIWYVLYVLEKGHPPESWDHFVTWVNKKLAENLRKPTVIVNFMDYFMGCKDYYDTIFVFNFEGGTHITMGDPGIFFAEPYGNSYFCLENFRPLKSSRPTTTSNDISDSTINSESRRNSVRTTERRQSFSLPPAILPLSPISESNSDSETITISPISNNNNPSVSLTSPQISTPLNSSGVIHKIYEYARKPSDNLYDESFLEDEKKWLKKNPDAKNFRLSKKTLKSLRKVISSKLIVLVNLKEYPYERILMAEIITNFVIDTFIIVKDFFTSLGVELKDYAAHQCPETRNLIEGYSALNVPIVSDRMDIHLKNKIIYNFLEEYLELICSDTVKPSLLNLMKICFEEEFLSLTVDCTFHFPKFDLFNDKNSIDLCPKEDEKSIDSLLVAYSEYVKQDGAFSGYTELQVLKGLSKFREYGKKLAKGIRSNYDVKSSHVGGDYIKQDGNCLITYFIYDYLKYEAYEKKFQEEMEWLNSVD